MNKRRQMILLLLLCVASVTLGVFTQGPKVANASAGTVTSYEKITWGISTGRYGVNGIHAFCAEYSKSWPPVGATIETISLSTNEILRKALYYGYNGPENTLGTDAKAHVLTAIAISDANIGERETGASATYDTFYWDLVDNPSKYPSPPSNFKAYLAITSSTSQQDLAFYQIDKNGYVKATKKSSNQTVTKGNSCYSLSGAKYTLYSSSSLAAGTKVGTLTTDASGKTGTVELPPGTYYAAETTAPKGYAKSTEVTKFTVKSEKTTTLEFSDVPQTNPVEILLQKVDSETETNLPRGDASLQGAQFTVHFYTGLWEKEVDPETMGKVPVRTWVFETDEKGCVLYRKSHLVSGDALYESLPLGTITIQETKASEGYLVNDTVFVRQITAKGTAETVHTYGASTVPEVAQKVIITKYQSGTTVPIPKTVFEVTKPDGSTEKFVTDENGKFTIVGLKYGRYEVREVTVMEGYELHQETVTFSVNAKSPEVQNLIIYNEPKPYDVVICKKDHHGNLLCGAEFTVYTDAACAEALMQGVTDENGILKFCGLRPEKHYYVKETKAPSGYQVPLAEDGEPFEYEWYAISTPAKEEFAFYVNGTQKEANSSPEGIWEGKLEIFNDVGYVLPNTGSNAPLYMVLVGAALCGMSICSTSKKRKLNMEHINEK